MSTPIIYKIPSMVCSGLLAGFMLELLIPNESVYTEKNGFRLGRQHFIFGGICMATWISYYRQD
jgi:hypothetical protein